MTTQELIRLSYEEDIPFKDITTSGLKNTSKPGRAQLIAKEDLILSAKSMFQDCILFNDKGAKLKWYFEDGDLIYKDQCIVIIEGDLIHLIQAERVALNFISHLSGIATLTRCFSKEVEHTACKILDTRKTTPLLRDLEKQAVINGQGKNHRRDLSDGILIKENHVRLAGSITAAIEQIRSTSDKPIVVETTNLNEIKEAIHLDVQRIMLDNMNNEALTQALAIIPPHIETEASGNMNLERVKSVAELGVNFISVGAITHSAPVADMSLLFKTN